MTHLPLWTLAVALFGLSALTLVNSARAEEQPRHRVLLELFASQGCSSCPSADEFLGQIGTPDFLSKAVILSWHVHYWDYLGWKDKYASKEFTARQQKYVELRRVRGLVTPQLMLGNKPLGDGADLVNVLKREEQRTPEYSISIIPKSDGKKINVSISLTKLVSSATLNPNVKLVPILVQNRATTKPLSGENRGAALVEHFIVLQSAESTPAANALSSPVTVSFDAPEFVDPSNLNVTVLLENTETLMTLECASETVSPKQ